MSQKSSLIRHKLALWMTSEAAASAVSPGESDKTVKMQPVVTANEVGTSHVMIAKGLAVGDQVVTEGQFRLKPGSKVQALKPGEVPAAPTAAELQKAKANGQKGGGRRGG